MRISGKLFIEITGLFTAWWVKNKDVEILAVVHGARDMRKLFPEEEGEL
jgi:hypothetical protein